MTNSPLGREFESGEGAVARALRFLVWVFGCAFLCLAAVLPMHWPQQAVLAVATLAIATWLHRSSHGRFPTLALVLLSVFSMLRYAIWRIASATAFLHDPASYAGLPVTLSIFALLAAEIYCFAVLLMGYLQGMWPLDRVPAPLPDDPEEWPAVDVLIPTLNEPLDLVRDTALAAMNIDWPGEKLKVWLLDDGCRKEFRAFATEAGIGYLAREDHSDAKAGNINHALQHTRASFVAIFDCDQAPTRSFLQVTMGWLLRDARLAVVQTPHRFYSADPFERNLGGFGTAPGEEQLFHGAIQSGNDLWNAASFSGSCAVLRRAALDEIGGIATETVTEDVHTSLRLQKRGWDTAFINLPQSAGLATERLRSHVRQRTRWACGMMQTLRLEDPLWGEGLRWQQRLCYLNGAAYFLSALPRLVFLVAPAAYLVFGWTALPGVWPAVAAYAIPYLLLAGITRARIHGRQRHALWSEIYETVMAPYILLPTLSALLRPQRANFKVTEKGSIVEHEFYDVRMALPYLLLLLLNLAALACALLRAVQIHPFVMAGWAGEILAWATRLHIASSPGAVSLNALWALFNVGVLCVAAGAARESAQRRRSVRVAIQVPADVIFADGKLAQGVTCDLSRGGMRARAAQAACARPGDGVEFILPLIDGAVSLKATVVSVTGDELRARFGELGLREAEALTTLLYSRADAWLGWGEGQRAGSLAKSLAAALRLPLRGVRRIFGSKRAERSAAVGIAPLLLAGLLLSGGTRSYAQQARRNASTQVAPATKNNAAIQPPAKDLAMLPQVFSSQAKPVPVVFAAQPSAKELQAAGIVASWLGVMHGRPVHFAVSVGTVPSGNAIVLEDGTSATLSTLGMKANAGPTAALAANPNDATSVALVLSGSNDDELLTAATALAFGSNTWHGQQMRVDKFVRPAPRALDDAPRWLSTDRIATFAQARIDGNGDLQGDGSQPVTATLRLPPDLDYQDGFGRQGAYQQNLALHLDYRYNAVPLGEGSTLDVYVNGAYISSTPMPHTDKASEVLETVVPVPTSALRAGDNDFSFRFSFHVAQGGSVNAPHTNLMGAVLKDSSLDISGLPHWTRLPDLALFARAGYPFTRRADLAETAFVLPHAPTSHEVEVFLALVARMGAQTGLPAVNLTVTDAAIDVSGGDLLVLGTPQDQPAIAKLDAALPVGISATGLHLREAEGIFGGRARSLLERFRLRSLDDSQQFGQVQAMGELPDATVEEIEWPRGSAHTALVIVLRDDAGAASFAEALSSQTADAMAQSVSVLNGARFSSYRLGDDGYWVGSLSPWEHLEFLLEDSPWTVAVVVAIFCLLFAVLLQARLRRRARDRLQVPV